MKFLQLKIIFLQKYIFRKSHPIFDFHSSCIGNWVVFMSKVDGRSMFKDCTTLTNCYQGHMPWVYWSLGTSCGHLQCAALRQLCWSHHSIHGNHIGYLQIFCIISVYWPPPIGYISLPVWMARQQHLLGGYSWIKYWKLDVMQWVPFG